MAVVLIRIRARRDILDGADYLEQKGGVELAQHFLDASRATFEELAGMPRAGLLCDFRRPALRRLRRWWIKGFENWLVFYVPKRNGIEIVRVVHGARDIENLFS